ncbi:hypothetical protein DSECCO2_336170 [anaerobic digester metagenome]
MDLDLLIESIRKSMGQINADIDELYMDKNKDVQQVLERLNREAMILNGKLQKYKVSKELVAEESAIPSPPVNPPEENEPNNTRLFTLEELAVNDGRDGHPAYVAVNGFVYDVTSRVGWASGIHFGLRAGKDLTKEFYSCHGDPIFLESLPIVGYLS